MVVILQSFCNYVKGLVDLYCVGTYNYMMTTDEIIAVLESYGAVTITEDSRPFSETGKLFEYHIEVRGVKTYLRTGQSRLDAIGRMYNYIEGYMLDEVSPT